MISSVVKDPSDPLDALLATAAAAGIIGGYEREGERVRISFDGSVTTMSRAHALSFLSAALHEWTRATGARIK